MKSLWSSSPNQERPLPHLNSFCDESIPSEEIQEAMLKIDEQIKPFTTPITWKALQIEVD